MKIKAEITKWPSGIYSVYAAVRSGSLETGNHKSREAAKRGFVSICNRLGINRDKYEFADKAY